MLVPPHSQPRGGNSPSAHGRMHGPARRGLAVGGGASRLQQEGPSEPCCTSGSLADTVLSATDQTQKDEFWGAPPACWTSGGQPHVK